jgi:hypothetical protein
MVQRQVQKGADTVKPSKNEDFKERIMRKKWKSLEARGIERPKDKEENAKRAKEAHGY